MNDSVEQPDESLLNNSEMASSANIVTPNIKEHSALMRFFTSIYIDPSGTITKGGRYSGRKPKQAAIKAFTNILKVYNVAGKSISKIDFGVAETTRDSLRLTYWFSGERTALDKPVEIMVGEKLCHYTFSNTIKYLTDKTIINKLCGNINETLVDNSVE